MTNTPLVDTAAVAGAIAFFVPLLVSFVTKRDASDGVKAAAGAAGAVVAALIGLWAAPDHAPVTWQLVVNTLIFALITQIGAYKAIWQHNLSPVIADATQNFGVGRVVKGEVLADSQEYKNGGAI